MAESHVCGQYTTHESGGSGGNLNPGNVISCILSIQFAPKFILTKLVFEINKRKNAQKVEKKLTIIYHYLLEEDSNGHVFSPRKLLKFEARKCHVCCATGS
jgi:hypothetical protein